VFPNMAGLLLRSPYRNHRSLLKNPKAQFVPSTGDSFGSFNKPKMGIADVEPDAMSDNPLKVG